MYVWSTSRTITQARSPHSLPPTPRTREKGRERKGEREKERERTVPMEGHASLQEVRVEIAGVVKQIGRVEFNSNAVEAAIAGKGTYRGYSGEDVFLKSNLRVVQREMMKQLRRRERSLTHRKRKLEANLGLAALATQTPQPAAAAVGEQSRERHSVFQQHA